MFSGSLIFSVCVLVMKSQSTVQYFMGPGNFDERLWKVTSNWVDINFIHRNIHNWSCKKYGSFSAIRKSFSH